MRTQDDVRSVQLADYIQPSYWAPKVDLQITLDPQATQVVSRVRYNHNPGHPKRLELNGKELRLLKVSIDGRELPLANLKYDAEHLFLENLPETFELELVTETCPKNNKALEGIYVSGASYYTQCEPQGFRRITYFQDRPDVMAEYVTTLIADAKTCPILLSNGNLVSEEKLPGNRLKVKWHDPFPKPSYLFALVGGQLTHKQDSFVTASGKPVSLHIYVDPENAHKCDFAFEAIKKAMRWDEQIYGLEYDLERFMVVAVNDFNMGAMENKGLNIFNAKYVLASPETASDRDFENILGIVGHEYFHNWTGNRVTLRDWFQLSLKEGLTVFRDQMFSIDEGAGSVKRIMDVKRLRERQFPEDGGPMSHPVRPESYIEINNFYTATVYEKGAEIIRMLYTLLGPDLYYRGMDHFFKRFDGQAVTIEDFLRVLEEATGRNLTQFKLWYQQAGTPTVTVEREADATGVTLHIKQQLVEGAAKTGTAPQLMPIKVAFLGAKGGALESQHAGQSAHEHLIELNQAQQSFRFEGLPADAIPSVLRGFTAPVNLAMSSTPDEDRVRLAAETDAFNRYEAAQKLALASLKAGRLDPSDADAFARLLRSADRDPRLVALALQAPSLDYLLHQQENTDLEDLYARYQTYLKSLAQSCSRELYALVQDGPSPAGDDISKEAIAQRELRNTCLDLLSWSGEPQALALIKDHYRKARSMNDKIAALNLLASSQDPERQAFLDDFYNQWKHDPLVMDKWFSAQAGSLHPDALAHAKALVKHPAFDMYNPNRVYSVFRMFGKAHPKGFHHPSGEGYKLVQEYVLKIDKTNPQVASSLANLFGSLRKVNPERRKLMRASLQAIADHGPLSPDVYEVVTKSLATAP